MAATPRLRLAVRIVTGASKAFPRTEGRLESRTMSVLARHPPFTIRIACLFELKPEDEPREYQQPPARACDNLLHPYLIVPRPNQSCRPPKIAIDEVADPAGKYLPGPTIHMSISADILRRLLAQPSFDCKQ